jgi:hypothetical protein
VIGDVHAGSDSAVSPAEIELDSGNVISANEVQLALLHEFEKMCDTVGKVDLLILNGDLVDGQNYIGKGKGILTSDMARQVDTAVEVISNINFRKVVGCSGTPYHVERNPNLDKMVIEKLGGVCLDEVSITVEETRIYANHRTSIRMNGNRAQSITTDMIMSELNAESFGKKVDVIFKSHAHYYMCVDNSRTLGFVCPCWKGRDEYARSATSPFSFLPHIGYIVLDVESDGSFSWFREIKQLKPSHNMKNYDLKDIPTRY